MASLIDVRFKRWTEARVAEGVELGRAEGVELGRAEGVELGRAEGVELGLAEGRVALLKRLAARRFGADVAGRMTVLLANVSDTSRLDAVGEWLTECPTGDALLERIPAIANGRDVSG